MILKACTKKHVRKENDRFSIIIQASKTFPGGVVEEFRQRFHRLAPVELEQ